MLVRNRLLNLLISFALLAISAGCGTGTDSDSDNSSVLQSTQNILPGINPNPETSSARTTALPSISSSTTSLIEDLKYAIANKCYKIKTDEALFLSGNNGNWVLTPTETSSSAIYMRPSALAEYLFYDSTKHLLVGLGIESAIVPNDTNVISPIRTTKLSNAARWKMVSNPDGTLSAYQSFNGSDWWLSQNNNALVLTKIGGNAIKLNFIPTTGCSEFPELPLHASGKPTKTTRPDGSLIGAADTHFHAFSNLTAGKFVYGDVFHPLGVSEALKDAEPILGKGASYDFLQIIADMGIQNESVDVASIGAQFILKSGKVDTKGWPTFNDWPAYNKVGFQLSYYRWIQRAYLGGMRLITMEANAFGPYCRMKRMLGLVYDKAGTASIENCDNAQSVDRQIQATYDLQDYIDAQEGGPGKGWFRIVKSPAEARSVIKEGKLAVVLGYEWGTMWGCTMKNPLCTEDYIKRKVQEAYDRGIRAVYPQHRIDTAFGGALNDSSFFALFGMQENGKPSDLVPCKPNELDDLSKTPEELLVLSHMMSDKINSDQFLNIFKTLRPILGIAGLAYGIDFNTTFKGYPKFPAKTQLCNPRPLTPLGKVLITELMKRGMLINGDHVGEQTYMDMLALTERYQYPLIHEHANNLGTDALFMRTLKNGGYISTIPNAWGNSAACVRYSNFYKKAGLAPVCGMSTDIGSMVPLAPPPSKKQPGFDYNLLKNQPGFNFKITYPLKSYDESVILEPVRLGNRTNINFETDGQAHYGMFPESWESIRQFAGQEVYDSIFNAAEAYIRTWELAEKRAKMVQ